MFFAATESSDPSVIAVIGLVVALVSAGISLAAWKVSKGSLDNANASLSIAQEQHKEFLRQLRARAALSIAIEIEGALDNLLETDADKLTIRWNIGIKNVGDKPAFAVTANFRVPSDLQDLTWTLQDGEHVPSNGVPVMTTNEALIDEQGELIDAIYLQEYIERISVSPDYVSYAKADLETPPAGEDRIVPVELELSSDDLAVDAVERHEVTIRRKA